MSGDILSSPSLVLKARGIPGERLVFSLCEKAEEAGVKDGSSRHRIPLLSLGLHSVGTTLGKVSPVLGENSWLILPGNILIALTRGVPLVCFQIQSS